MKERAYAKINLCLDVVGVREDGYHDLRMIMAPINFYDLLEMEPAAETSIQLNRSYLPVNEKNTVIKAIRVLRDRYGFREQFACTLQKHIPTQAGLAGGSADAAAAIRLLNRMLKLRMSEEDMIEAGRQVGADVPFCLMNRPALVEGIGDRLDSFPIRTQFEILLVKPRFGVSTRTAFEQLNLDKADHPDCLAMRQALITNDYPGVIRHLGNSLEEVSLRLVSQICSIKSDLLAMGFDGALMSGSGSTVFGLTRDAGLVWQAADQMKQKGYFVRVTNILK